MLYDLCSNHARNLVIIASQSSQSHNMPIKTEARAHGDLSLLQQSINQGEGDTGVYSFYNLTCQGLTYAYMLFQEKELENLAAMDMELQQIATKLHDNST